MSAAAAADCGTDGDLSLYESHGTRVGSRTEPCGTDDDVNAPLAAGEYTDEMVARHDTHGASALPVGSTAS